MKQNGVKQLHIVPFDLGIVFYDCLSIDNTKNLMYSNIFCEKLSSILRTEGMTLQPLFEIKQNGVGRNKSPATIRYKECDFVDQAICRIELEKNLVCYILSNGIGIFMFADLMCDALVNTDKEIFKYNKALVANYQKKVSQATILNRAKFPDVCPTIEEKMLFVRQKCWEVIKEGVKKKLIQHVRPFSGNIDYKSQGLSYVLTIYLFKQNEISDKDLNSLLCGTFFSGVVDKNNWEKINSQIENADTEEKPAIVKAGSNTVYFSWSAVACKTEEEIETIEDLKKNRVLCSLLKVESYVQSRWFIADNSMDNVNKSSKYTMESLQRIASLMEFYQAELDNEISANMGTLQKNLLKPVVETSEVKNLYKSVLSQIKTQVKIKEAHYQDKKTKNKLVADLFLAIFTASSLFKTVMDIVNENFTWLTALLFGATMLIAIGTIIFNYKNR